MEEKVLNQVIFGRSSYDSLGATATDWALLQTPRLLMHPLGNESQIFTDNRCTTLAFSAELPAEVPLTTASFRIHSQPSSVRFEEKTWKELIAICNYNSVWQCLWVNGAHISKLPLLSQPPTYGSLLPANGKSLSLYTVGKDNYPLDFERQGALVSV